MSLANDPWQLPDDCEGMAQPDVGDWKIGRSRVTVRGPEKRCQGNKYVLVLAIL